LTSARIDEAAVVPPGATSAVAMLGLVRAAFELAAQIQQGVLPSPDRVVLALGSGGTAAGLAVGLGLAGVPATVHAVATVERLMSPRFRIRALVRGLMRELSRAGIDPGTPRPIRIDRSEVGRGYGLATPRSFAGARELIDLGLAGEAVYTGKAWGAIGRGRGRVLFWDTARRGKLEVDPDWKNRLPPALMAALPRAIEAGHEPPKARGASRRLLLTGGVLALAAGAAHRAGRPRPGLDVLSGWEAEVLEAAGGCILPPAPIEPVLARLPANVDRFIATLDRNLRTEIHAMLALIEIAPVALMGSRFTRLSIEERLRFLERLRERGGVLEQASRGIRDLIFLGYYQAPETWPALGYGGTWVTDAPRPSAYDRLRARTGELPRAARP
jgi:D-cysteine desulfhydrase